VLTVNVRPKVKLEIVVEDKDKPIVVEAILKHARTGEVGPSLAAASLDL
jgi:nitrogen regulatory protein PII